MISIGMQKFAVIFLAAFVTLLGFAPLVEGASVANRETNADRFARGLTPLPPVRRTKTFTADRRKKSNEARSQTIMEPQSGTGRLEVRWASDDSIAGYVQNDPTRNSLGLGSSPLPEDRDLHVDFSKSNLLVMDPEFPSPRYIGGRGWSPLAAGSPTTIRFTNVQPGPSAAIWSLNSITGALTATWVNPDGTTINPSLVYDPVQNKLSFTGDPTALSNSRSPPAVFPVHIFLTTS